MSKNREKSVKTRRRGSGRIYKTVSVVLILALIVVSISIFFRVETVEVSGAEICPAEDIVTASDIRTGDSMIFMNRFEAADRVFNASTYIKSATITRKFPSTVIIGVVERVPVASVRIGDSYWLLDSEGRLLEKVEKGSTDGLMNVVGVVPRAPSAGDYISLGETEKVRRDYLVTLLGLLEKYDLCGNIGTLNMSDTTDVTFDYLERYTVRLGQDDNLNDKVAILDGVVAQLGEYDMGEIDLSKAQEAHFIPA